MNWQFVPLHPLFGAEIAGVAITELDDAQIAQISEALATHGLLLLRGMPCDDDMLTDFASRFGSLQNLSGRPEAPTWVLRVTNLAQDGSIKPDDEPSRKQHDANRLWHADGTFMNPGTSYSFLQARIITSEGGQTEFCDTRLAWDALPAEQKTRLLPLKAHHSMLESWKKVGVAMPGTSRETMPGIARPLVHFHRQSGRNALMIPSHVEQIEGFDYAQGQQLLADLVRAATAPDQVYRHHWLPGDLLIWDNRCMLHRVTPYPGSIEPRELRTCRVVNEE